MEFSVLFYLFFPGQIQGKGKGYGILPLFFFFFFFFFFEERILPLLILQIDEIIGRYFTFVNQFLLLILKKMGTSQNFCNILSIKMLKFD
jgi:hypothetical protein